MSLNGSDSSQVWDPLVRIFHWSVAAFFALAYLLEGDWPGLHSHAGYTVALLVAFRIVWGFIGSSRARFSNFIASPAVTVRYLRELLGGRSEPYTGHDPAGAVMILVLLFSLLTTALSGMSLFAMEGSGPLAHTFVASWPDRLMVEVHEFSSEFTLWMVVVHVSGVLLTSVLHGRNLVKAMVTGYKNGSGS